MSMGHVCENNVVVTADPPAGVTGHQWYLNGVALTGETGSTLNVSALGLGSGTYTMAGTYDGECLMGSTHVMVPDAPAPLPHITPANGCAPLTVSFEDVTGPLSVASTWSFGDGAASAGSAVTHTYAAPGTYDVTLGITTGMGCVRDTVLPGAVVVHPGPVGAISATPNPTDVEHTAVVLSGSVNVGDIVAWWWDLGTAEPASSSAQALTATFPAEPGNYPVMLVVISAGGCVDTVRSVVRMVRPGVIEMPNVFSPNGDGENDRFIPLDHNDVAGSLEIYNRWGQVVFSTRSLDQGWSGIGVPEGTYYYLVTPDDQRFEKRTGHITLLR
ncbi:MAG: PKD domain-containing protein [Flavobacteriales bacterium]